MGTPKELWLAGSLYVESAQQQRYRRNGEKYTQFGRTSTHSARGLGFLQILGLGQRKVRFLGTNLVRQLHAQPFCLTTILTNVSNSGTFAIFGFGFGLGRGHQLQIWRALRSRSGGFIAYQLSAECLHTTRTRPTTLMRWRRRNHARASSGTKDTSRRGASPRPRNCHRSQ